LIANSDASQIQSVAVFADEPEEIPAGKPGLESPCSEHAMFIAAGFRD
jgi:hypothetical protein